MRLEPSRTDKKLEVRESLLGVLVWAAFLLVAFGLSKALVWMGVPDDYAFAAAFFALLVLCPTCTLLAAIIANRRHP